MFILYMTIIELSPNTLQSRKTNKLDNMIYSSFKKLEEHPKLKHTKQEIYKLLNSRNVKLYLYILNNKISGYLLGEIMKLSDGRNVFFITYLYTAVRHRNKGIASLLLDIVDKFVDDNELSGIMLITDTEDIKVFDWYLKKGFMQDNYLRNYERYDVMFKGSY